MLVYVLKQNGQPFMPTERFGKVRRLLKEGKAKVVRREPFTIRLLYEPETDVFTEEIVKDMEEQAEMFEKVLDTVKEDCRK